MSYLPLLEVSSDLVSWPRSVLTHLQLEDGGSHSSQSPMLGKISRSGNIAVVAQVKCLFILIEISFQIFSLFLNLGL